MGIGRQPASAVLFAFAAVLCLPMRAYAQEKHWNTLCQSESRAAPLSCMASELVFLRQNRQRLFEIKIIASETAPLRLLVTGPLGFDLGQGIEILVDGKTATRARIAYCLKTGCAAELTLDDDLIETLLGGKVMSLVLVAQKGQKITTPIPLDGLRDAYEKIKPH